MYSYQCISKSVLIFNQIVGLGFCSKSLTFVNFEVRIPLFIYCSVKECLFDNTELNKIIILKYLMCTLTPSLYN